MPFCDGHTLGHTSDVAKAADCRKWPPSAQLKAKRPQEQVSESTPACLLTRACRKWLQMARTSSTLEVATCELRGEEHQTKQSSPRMLAFLRKPPPLRAAFSEPSVHRQPLVIE